MKTAFVNVLYLDESHHSDSSTFLKHFQSCVSLVKHLSEEQLATELSDVSVSKTTEDKKDESYEFVLIVNESCRAFLQQCPVTINQNTPSTLYSYITALYNGNVVVLPNESIIEYKMHCWALVQYDVVVYLDADVYVEQYATLQELAHLGSRVLESTDQILASSESTWCDMFNTGVFVIKPSISKYKDICAFSQENKSIDGKDQGILNQYFNSDFFPTSYTDDDKTPTTASLRLYGTGNNWIRLSYVYNVMITPRLYSSGQNTQQLFLYSIESDTPTSSTTNATNIHVERTQNTGMFNYFLHKCKIVHFIVKPWIFFEKSPAITLEAFESRATHVNNHNIFYYKWKQLFDKHVPREIQRYPINALHIKPKSSTDQHREEDTELLDVVEVSKYSTNFLDNEKSQDTLFPWSQYPDYPQPTRSFQSHD